MVRCKRLYTQPASPQLFIAFVKEKSMQQKGSMALFSD